MSRLDIKTQNRAQTVVDNLYRDVERRIAASPPGLCPVDMSLAFLKLCHAQSCGKCVPCRIGLGQLSLLIEQVVDGTATMETLAIIEKTARSIVNTADCAIGRDAARLVVDGLEGFREDAALAETETFLDRVYQGSLSMMVSAMTRRQAISKEEIDELYELLRQMEEGTK